MNFLGNLFDRQKPLMHTPFVLAIYLACLVVVGYTEQASLELFSFHKRMVGVATLNGISIPKRVGLFTNSLFYFLVTVGATFLVGQFALFRRWISEDLMKSVNYLAFAGLGLLFFDLFGAAISGSTGLIGCMMLLLLVQDILEKFTERLQWNSRDRWPMVAISVLLGLTSYAAFKEMAINFLEVNAVVPVSIFVFLFGSLFLSLMRRFTGNDQLTYRILFAALPILFFPALSVLSDELYLILNNRSIFGVSPKLIYITGVVLLIGFMLGCFLGLKRLPESWSLNRLLCSRYIPFFLIAVGFFTFHNAFLHVRPEFFEVGNPALGIQRWHLFGEVPLFESFNSHLLAELVYGFLYTSINGFNGLDYNLYYFLNRVVYGLLTYAFLNRFWKNPYAALGMALFMAFYTSWMPRSFFMALLMPFALEKLTKSSSSTRSDGLFLMIVTLLIVWRIDIGFANLLAACGTLLVVHVFGSMKVPWLRLLKNGLVWLLVIAGLVFGYAYVADIPFLDNAEQALHYLSSTQTYGYLTIFPDGLDKGEWHYYIFPFAVVVFLLYMLLYGLKASIERGEHFAGIGIIYLGIFYLANLQRGIVRHGLVEGTDEIHTSFGFFILSVVPFFTAGNQSLPKRIMTSVALSILLIAGFKYNGVSGSVNWYHQYSEKLTTYRHITPQDTVIDRLVRPPSYHEGQFAALKKLMQTELGENATFLDFSNTPILYFLLDRRVPSYFNQNILSVHDDFLQEKAVEQLQKEDIPFVVYSHYPQTWHDEVDGVPNSLRHYKIAEYIFNNYTPYAVVNNFCVWKRKEIDAPTIQHIELSVDSNGFRLNEPETQRNMAVVLLENAYTDSLLIEQSKHYAGTTVNNGKENTYTFNSLNQLLDVPYRPEIGKSFEVYEATYFPDTYSGRVRHFDLKLLPLFWQRYDPIAEEKETLAELNHAISGDTVEASIPSGIDKTSGNYLLVSLAPEHDLSGSATLTYGLNKVPQGYFSFTIRPDQNDYLIRLSTQYRWIASENDYFRLSFPQTGSLANKVKGLQVLKGN